MTVKELIDSNEELKTLIDSKDNEIAKLTEDKTTLEKSIVELTEAANSLKEEKRLSVLDQVSVLRLARGLTGYEGKDSELYKKLSERSLEYLLDALADEKTLETKIDKASEKEEVKLVPTSDPGLKIEDKDTEDETDSLPVGQFSAFLGRVRNIEK